MPDLWDAHRRRTPVPVAHPGPAQVFRRKFCDGLERLYGKGLLELSDPSAQLQHREQFTALMDQLRHKKKWIVYTKPPFGGPAHVLRYLGRYTHRIAISNHRLLGFDGEQVTLRWRDSAHGNKQRAMTLDATEFLRRFFLHVLPKGFVRIRHYGLLSNRFRQRSLELARKLLAGEQRNTLPALKRFSRQHSALALSQMRRSHARGAKTHCPGLIPVQGSGLFMTAYSIPDCGLASCTPLHSCAQPQLNHPLRPTVHPVKRLNTRPRIRNITALWHHSLRSRPLRLIHAIPGLHSKSIIPSRITASA